jgi:hypothetical protein
MRALEGFFGLGLLKGRLSMTVMQICVRAVVLAGLTALSAPLAAARADTEFGIEPGSYSAAFSSLQAGAHPDLTVAFKLNLTGTSPDDLPVDHLKSVLTKLPAGVVGNPQVAPRCKAGLLWVQGFCPRDTQVGVFRYALGGIPGNPTNNNLWVPVYNMVPEGDHPAELAFLNTRGGKVVVPILTSVGPANGYRVVSTVEQITANVRLFASSLTLWGVPGDPSHDGERGRAGLGGGCLGEGGPTGELCPSGQPARPFLSNPTQCGVGGTTDLTVDSWQRPGLFVPMLFSVAQEMGGCEALSFAGSLGVQPESRRVAGPSGYEVRLHIPQDEEPNGLATPHLRKASVVLPEGVRISPSAAAGLQGCSDEQLGLRSDADVGCPDGSKIGTVVVHTPLLPDPLEGAVYQGTQTAEELVRIFVVVKGPGVIVKLPGSVSLDPVTGQVSATFDDNPQLPFEDFVLRFKGGPRAPLSNPRSCGVKTTTSTLTSYAGSALELTDSFEVSGDGVGGPCPAPRFTPVFEAGTVDPVAGKASRMRVRFAREDEDGELGSLEMSTPPGLLGRIADVDLCQEPQAAAGTCGRRSRIGTVTTTAGAGPQPLSLGGRAYLTGPYKGQPFGLSVVVPAKAGPLDLGDVVVRASIQVRDDGSLRVVSDPLPSILQGIPLQVRSVAVDVDRPGFVVNPTNCDTMHTRAQLSSTEGQTAQLSSRFQVADCAALAFKPKLALRLTGPKQVKTGKHPGLRATVTQTHGQAAINKAVVRLPKALALDPDNARTLCEFDDGTKDDIENHCPKGSIVGRVKALTPLLDEPLAGNVYFVKNVRRAKSGNLIRTLPMLVVALRGQIAINLRGESSSTHNGQLVNTFKSVPDAPIKQFNLNINGGANGILTITRTAKNRINLCAKPNSHLAKVQMAGHNGKRRDFGVRVKTPCAPVEQRRAGRERGRGRV